MRYPNTKLLLCVLTLAVQSRGETRDAVGDHAREYEEKIYHSKLITDNLSAPEPSVEVQFNSPEPFGETFNQRKSRSNVPNIVDCAEEDVITYTAAVIEFEPTKTWTSGEGLLLENLRRILEFAKSAKELGADIFVAPEYGLQSLDMTSNSTEWFLSLTQVVPDPGTDVVPCDEEDEIENFEAIRQLSCAARQLDMYVVVDVAELVTCDGNVTDCVDVFYNTQAVFDREGALIARYRKQNLYLEPFFEPGPQNDTQAIFETDFGVKFSLQICFDISFEHPGYNNVRYEDVRDVVMSTAWVDSAPFIFAINIHNGWTRGLGTNLMVSGYHWPERSKMGSGIYLGYSDMTHTYTYDSNSGDVLVVSPVKTCRSGNGTRVPQVLLQEPRRMEYSSNEKGRIHLVFPENLSKANITVLSKTKSGESASVTLCHDDGLCCHLRYEHSKSNLTYQLMSFSGVLVFGQDTYEMYIQLCAVLWCTGDDWWTCIHITKLVPEDDVFGPFFIEGNFESDVVFPMALFRNLTLVPNDAYQYSNVGSIYTVAVEDSFGSLMASGLFGRWFSNDP